MVTGADVVQGATRHHRTCHRANVVRSSPFIPPFAFCVVLSIRFLLCCRVQFTKKINKPSFHLFVFHLHNCFPSSSPWEEQWLFLFWFCTSWCSCLTINWTQRNINMTAIGTPPPPKKSLSFIFPNRKLIPVPLHRLTASSGDDAGFIHGRLVPSCPVYFQIKGPKPQPILTLLASHEAIYWTVLLGSQ